MSLMCVTNDMPDYRSCTIKDEHQIVCDGWQYRWNTEKNRQEATGRECRGCLPREARHGLLCWGCWENVQHAFAEWPPFAEKIAGVERAVQRDNGGIRSSALGYVPIPGTVLAVEEIRSYLRSYSRSVDLWVASPEGAKDSIRFARAVTAAVRTHAVEEKAHKIKRTRCTECKQLTLVWRPAAREGDDVTVKCSNTACATVLDQSSFEKITAIEKPGAPIPAGDLPKDARGDFAEMFDPTRPEHEALDPLSTLRLPELRAIAEDLEIPRINQFRKVELINAIRSAQDATPLEETA